MHIIQVVRNYLGLSQLELAKKAGLSQPDLCEMETKEPYQSYLCCISSNIANNSSRSRVVTIRILISLKSGSPLK